MNPTLSEAVSYRGVGPCRVTGYDPGTKIVTLQQVHSVGPAPQIKISLERYQIATRPLIQPDEVAQIFEILKGTPVPMPNLAWVKRKRLVVEKLTEGLLDEIAGIYRDISANDPSYAERSLADIALQYLVGEIAIVTGRDRKDVQADITSLFVKEDRDLSMLVIKEVLLDTDTKIKFHPPLTFHVEYVENQYWAAREDIHIGAGGETRSQLETVIQEDIKFLWEEFAREAKSRLAPSGIRLKDTLLRLGQEGPINPARVRKPSPPNRWTPRSRRPRPK